MNIYDPDSCDSDMLERLSYAVCNYWGRRELNTNTGFSVTECVLSIIPHICKDSSGNSDGDNMKQVNNVIKTLFYGLSEDEFHVNPDLFWYYYTDFNHDNDPFDGDEYIWKSKDISDDNIHLWHNNSSLRCNKVFGFVACIVT